MKTYHAKIDSAGELVSIEFTIDINPIEYIWAKYGISTYIAQLEEIEEEVIEDEILEK